MITRCRHRVCPCVIGLISSEDPDRVEACLTVAEGIIRSQPDGLREVNIFGNLTHSLPGVGA